MTAQAAVWRRFGLWRWCGLAGGALGLAACGVGPAFQRPTVPLSATWQVSQADASALPPEPQWWHAFGSAQLDDYIAKAQAGNDDIAAAIARVLEADAQARIAGAALLPSVTLSAQATRQRSLPVGGGAARTFDDYSPQLSASYELDFWGKNRASRDAALAAARASRYDRETIALTAVTSVAMSYFEALELQDRLSVAQNNLANAQSILKDLEFEQHVGIVTALDVAQQATTVAALNALIPPLTQQLAQSTHTLAILIGLPPEQLAVTSGGLGELSQPALGAGLPSQLLTRRPDIAAAEARLVAANADIGAARAAFFPSIDLSASGGYASTALSSLLSPASRVFALTAGATEAIFEGGARRGQYEYTQAYYAELLADYHKTVLSALGNVEDALVAVQQTAEQQLRQQDAVDKAQRAFDFSQVQLQAGTTNVLAMLNTQTALFTAQDTLVQVKFQHMQALLNLYQALGGGWQQGRG